MKVLMISTDRTIFDDGSPAQSRMIEYGSLVTELHIIVFVREESPATRLSEDHGFSELRLSRNTFAYSTASKTRKSFFKDARSRAEYILKRDKEKQETVQATDVNKARTKNDKVIRSIFEDSNTMNARVPNDNEEGKGWLVTTQDPFETGLVGSTIKKQYGIPLQIQVHTNFLSRWFWRESLKNKMRVLMAKKIIKQADCIRVVSNRVKKALLKSQLVSSATPIRVLPIHVAVSKDTKLPLFDDIKQSNATVATPEGIDLRTRYPEHTFIILMASRLSREKNIPLAIRAIETIVRKHPGVLLVIVGDGPERKKLETMSAKLRNNIVFESWTDSLHMYYQTADIFLLTSNYEGYGRTVIEAQTFGLPVVMTDVGCAGEAIQDGKGARIIPVGNEQVLTQELLTIIEDPKHRNELRKGTKHIVNALDSKEEHLALHRKSWTSCGR